MSRLTVLVLVCGLAGGTRADDPPKVEPIDLSGVAKSAPNRAKTISRRFEEDRGSLMRAYPVAWSPARDARFMKYFEGWTAALNKLDESTFNEETKTELSKLKQRVETLTREWVVKAMDLQTVAPLVPFAKTIAEMEDARRRAAPVDAAATAGNLHQLKTVIATCEADIAKTNEKLHLGKSQMEIAAANVTSLQGALKSWYNFYYGYDPQITWWCEVPYKEVDSALAKYASKLKEVAKTCSEERAPQEAIRISPAGGPSDVPDLKAMLAEVPSEMIPVLERWQAERGGRRRPGGGGAAPGQGNAAGTDRNATWLASLKTIPFDTLSRPAQIDYLLLKNQLESQARVAALRAKNGPPAPREPDASGIRGRPIGAEMVVAEFAGEMVPYSPEELIALAEVEYKWCLNEMVKASREMGFGDDWKKALEKVKTLHVPAGKQPELVVELSNEAVEFVRKQNILTVPSICNECWRMSMIPPERQLVSPFFLGGEVIQIAYPTLSMAHEAKMQSMRGNNRHFSKATVHHELIPGHGLQQYYNDRTNVYRFPFSTAFWIEGWAVYMEMVLYDSGFPKSPEDRVGMMFWRMHRCARVVFSLGFHTSKMAPQECIEYLIDKVGHERANATAEVRRSFEGGYGPLYQCAYLVGATQFRALRKELVDTGKMTQQQYHDAVMTGNKMPVEMVRASLTQEKLTPESIRQWKFYPAK